jgi:hypothetical protein
MAEQKPWKMDFDSVEGLKHNNKLDPPGFDSVTARDWVRAGCRGFGSATLARQLHSAVAVLHSISSAAHPVWHLLLSTPSNGLASRCSSHMLTLTYNSIPFSTHQQPVNMKLLLLQLKGLLDAQITKTVQRLQHSHGYMGPHLHG